MKHLRMNVPFLCLLASVCLIGVAVEGQSSVANPGGANKELPPSQTIDNLFRGYDKRIPSTGQNGTLKISINCLILDVFSVDESKHEFTVTMFFRQHWLDTRLQYTKIPGMKYIVLDADHVGQIWTPDTFILNERTSIRHNFGTVQEYTKIRPDGWILQSARVTVTASCKMNLGYFPFDRQLCGLEFASYAHISPNYTLTWSSPDTGVGISEDLSASSLNFRFAGIKTTTKTLIYPSGNQTRLGLEFFFARHSSRFVQDVFFPTLFLTVVAFCTLYAGSSFLRVQLGVALMIAMVLLMSLNSSWMPRVSYQTALDLYVFISFLMIFVTLLVNFVQYNNFQKSGGTDSEQRGFRMLDLTGQKTEPLVDYERSNGLREPLCEPHQEQGPRGGLGLRFGGKLEDILQVFCKTCRRYLALSYFGFNVIYWMVVLIGSSWYPEEFLAMEAQE